MAIIIGKRKYGCFFLLPIICFLTACSVLDKAFSHEEATIYAELLFKKQNAMTQQVMMLEEDLTNAELDKVAQAELEMHEACHLLNELANREIEGVEMSVFFKKRVQGSFSRCEDSVKSLDTILKLMGFGEDF